MDSEFINVYIAKQKTWIEELVAKQIILETRLQIAEQTIVEKNNEIQVLKDDIDTKVAFINKLVDANAKKDEELNSLLHPELPKKKKKTEHLEVAQPSEADDF